MIIAAKFNYIARFLLVSGLREVFFQVKRENRHLKKGPLSAWEFLVQMFGIATAALPCSLKA